MASAKTAVLEPDFAVDRPITGLPPAELPVTKTPEQHVVVGGAQSCRTTATKVLGADHTVGPERNEALPSKRSAGAPGPKALA